MEKERWLKEQKLNHGGEGDGGDEGDGDESKFFALADRTLQRMTSNKEEKEEEEGPKEKVFKSPMAKLGGPLLPLQNGAMRGSFLARDADALSRLEKFNKHKEEKVGVGAKKGRNFVFAAISPPKEKEVVQEVEETEEKGKNKVVKKGPLPKKQKLNRNLDENSRRGTIFNLL